MKWKYFAGPRSALGMKLSYSGNCRITAPGELAIAKFEPDCSVPHSRHRLAPTSFSIF